jgi:RimJ/RimL family protein N-acetyltransferase
VNLLYGRDALVGAWIAKQLQLPSADFFAPYTAVGIAEDGQIKGGVLYNNYRADAFNKPISIEISGASLDKRCALRHIIRPLLEYPFCQLKVARVQFSIAKPNMVARRFAERLGFTLEGIARKAHYSGRDAAIYSLLRHECRWINESRRTLGPSSPRSKHNGSSPDSLQSGDCAL